MKQLGLLFCAMIFLAVMPVLLLAQSAERAAIDQILKSYRSFEQRLPAEKVYVHTDRAYYAAGDTLWLKVYAFDEASLKKPDKSSIVYVDFVNSNGRPFKQHMLRLQNGYGMGFIVLDGDNFREGDYLLRAYTRFMLNYGAEKLFTKSVSVYDKRPPTFTSITYRKISADSLALEMRLADLAGQPLMLHSFNLRVTQGRY
ncbi:MAG: hypothetical protein INR69_22600, partial [Mucilaginibacter polytrichastri]|nr:hypothetical protein [Mucilaginibacter polytrichastri]